MYSKVLELSVCNMKYFENLREENAIKVPLAKRSKIGAPVKRAVRLKEHSVTIVMKKVFGMIHAIWHHTVFALYQIE